MALFVSSEMREWACSEEYAEYRRKQYEEFAKQLAAMPPVAAPDFAEKLVDPLVEPVVAKMNRAPVVLEYFDADVLAAQLEAQLRFNSHFILGAQ